MSAPIVIVGSGLAGWTVARELRKLDPVVSIVVVTASPGHFYAKPTLSNALALGRTPAQIVTTPADKMAAASSVTLLAATSVMGIDAVARTVSLSDGQTLAYRDLVLANGAHPIALPMAGRAAQRVFRVNQLQDYADFHAALGQTSKRVLVIGAGLIGCEFANDLVVGGHQVIVVDPAQRPLASLLPTEAGLGMQTALAAAGVEWHFGTSVVALDEADAGGLLATLADGQSMGVDLVLSAVGLRADTRLAQAAGAVCERGVVVDERLATTAPGVWALGDNAQYPGARILPFVMPIMTAAKVLAANLVGQAATLAFPVMPVAVKTPAWPVLVVPPPVGLLGAWQSEGELRWEFRDASGALRGFVLAGAQRSQRAALMAGLAG
jgi:rubredoxin---NAD+ reductase